MLESLDRIVDRFNRAKVDLVVLLGGIDETFEGTRTTFARIIARLRAEAVLLALPGDRVSHSGFRAAADRSDRGWWT